jgi:ribosomal peptide maturation radical SAM protein 1
MRAPVILVSPPFTPLATPSLGLALLQGQLRARGIDCQVLSLGLDFARRAGQSDYQFVAEDLMFTPDLAGDWVFAEALNGTPGDAEGWFSRILEGGHPDHRKPLGMRVADPGAARRRLLALRTEANRFIDHWAARLATARPRVLGLTTVFAQNAAALALAKRVKSLDPTILLVLGGANAEGVMGEALFEAYGFLDVVVSGEGEHRFPPLVEAWLGSRPLPRLEGVLARPGLRADGPMMGVEAVDLGALPIPDYREWFEDFRASGLALQPRLLVETSRGCWWGEKSQCTFCGLNGLGMAFRSKPAERMLDEIRILQRRHPDCGFSVADNILGMDAFTDLLPALAAEPEPPRCFYEVKANLSLDQLKLLKAAGCTGIQPGIESLSDDVLRLMKKGLRALQAIQLLKHSRGLGLDVGWNIVGGFPGEDPGEYRRMAELVPLLTHLQPPYATSRIRLDRFSPLQENPAAAGLVDVHAMPSYGFVYGLGQAQLDRLAYFLRSDHADGRDPETYLAPLEAAVERWRTMPGSLIALEQGQDLLVFDDRECATSPMHLLRAAQAWVVRAADSVVSLDRLRIRFREDHPAAADEILHDAMNGLLEAQLLLIHGDRALALPILSLEVGCAATPS